MSTLQDYLRNCVRSVSVEGARLPAAIAIGVIVLVSGILMLPVWWIGLPGSGHDTVIHVAWQRAFSSQLWGGELYPRWLADMNTGLGSPAFFIYPPVSQFVAAVLAPWSDSFAWVYQRIGIAATVAFIGSGIGGYLWLRKLTSNSVSALVGAMVFLAAPYHLFIDTYYRSAYAELWAFTWAPFSLLAIHFMRDRARLGLILYSVATSALLLSHAPSCIALLPAYIAYAALLSIIHKQKGIFLWTCVATGIAILLAGAYLGTALTHQVYINTGALYGGNFDFGRSFLFSAAQWNHAKMKPAITAITLVQSSAIVVLGIMTIRSEVDRSRKWFASAAIAASLLVLFMMSSISMPVWAAISVLQKIQFAWRLLVLQTVCLAMIAALFSASTHAMTLARPGVVRRAMTPLLIAGLVAINLAMGFLHAPDFTTITPKPRDAPEYQLGSITKIEGLFDDGNAVALISGEGKVSLLKIASRDIELQVDAVTPVTFIVRHFYYPGWQCATPGGQVHCKVTKHDDSLSVIRVETGPGKQHMTLHLAPGTAEKSGWYATLAGLVLLVGVCLLIPRTPGRSTPRQAAAQPAVPATEATGSGV